jgi:hypothetical protein
VLGVPGTRAGRAARERRRRLSQSQGRLAVDRPERRAANQGSAVGRPDEAGGVPRNVLRCGRGGVRSPAHQRSEDAGSRAGRRCLGGDESVRAGDDQAAGAGGLRDAGGPCVFHQRLASARGRRQDPEDARPGPRFAEYRGPGVRPGQIKHQPKEIEMPKAPGIRAWLRRRNRKLAKNQKASVA